MRASLAPSCFALLLLLSSCGADWSSIHPTSHVALKWTIARKAEKDSCSKVRSTNVHVEIYLAGNDTGLFDRSFDAPCADFTTTMDLIPGGYFAYATLQDDNAKARGIITRIHSFNARADTDAAISVDFPRTSFFP